MPEFPRLSVVYPCSFVSVQASFLLALLPYDSPTPAWSAAYERHFHIHYDFPPDVSFAKEAGSSYFEVVQGSLME